MYKWYNEYYMGAAHGMSGILFILLQVKEMLTEKELIELVKPSIDWMMSICFPSSNLPAVLGDNSDRLVHWCHGAPGAIFLFSLAYKVFGDEKYLNHAKKCAEVIWNRGLLKKGYGLCHGTAGNGYGLLYLYQVRFKLLNLF